jgi:steroid delta-isomerase-like uncharacterized protein
MKEWSATCVVISLIIGAITGCSGECERAGKNKDLLLNALEVMNNREYDRYKEFFAEDFKRHSQATPEISINSLDEMLGFVKQWDQAFPDAKMETRKIAAEGDLVAVWVTYKGTHEGPMGDTPPTGKTMESETFGFFRIQEDKIVESWVTWDNVAVLKQLDLFPEAPTEEP